MYATCTRTLLNVCKFNHPSQILSGKILHLVQIFLIKIYLKYHANIYKISFKLFFQ